TWSKVTIDGAPAALLVSVATPALFDGAVPPLRRDACRSLRPAQHRWLALLGRSRGTLEERQEPGTRCHTILGLRSPGAADDHKHAVAGHGSPGQRDQAVFHVRRQQRCSDIES
ncbi:MAG TPA: hypothetical protein VF219_02930, partial [Vicinamibacterales bacterium]